MSRICLVGAGYIAGVHANVLRRLHGHSITTVVDPNNAAATRLAASSGAASVFGSVEEALAADNFDRACVLVPPDLHEAVATKLLAAGKPVLLEKPLAASPDACARLVQISAASDTALGVNQNFVHHPAFTRLRALLVRGALGRPKFVSCIYNAPLRQLATGHFGHRMFQSSGNSLLEQAVHPLSQIVTLAGSVGDVRAIAGPVREIAPGLDFVATLDAALSCARLPAQLRFAVGQDFPFWQLTVVCNEGVAVADILTNRMFTHRRTRWLEAVDRMLSGIATGGAIARDAVRVFAGYVGSMLHVVPPSACSPLMPRFSTAIPTARNDDSSIISVGFRHTLKRNSRISPSFTTYSLPSTRIFPASLAPTSPL
ncbi:MAG TPA: Gfo/Idh/MocA family oxidoreductase [Acetobacteraceae bacterium]|jgi:predicted dehydrogenase